MSILECNPQIENRGNTGLEGCLILLELDAQSSDDSPSLGFGFAAALVQKGNADGSSASRTGKLVDRQVCSLSWVGPVVDLGLSQLAVQYMHNDLAGRTSP